MMMGILALAVASASAPEPSAGACQLRSNYDFLRDLAFTRAATQVPQRSADLSRLRRAVRAEGVDVRSVSYEPATGRLECRMTLKLVLPASAQPYFGGADAVGGDVRYWAEPQDDGRGYSVLTEGLAPIIMKVTAAAARFPSAPDFGSPGLPAVAPAAAIATPTPISAPPPTPRRLPQAGFDCALATTAVEKMICDSDALADVDRTMSERYFAARKGLRGPARQRQLVSQRKFLSRRDACDDQACLVGLYMARAAELGR
jgi:uncharacterized protein YecT (DUF1311 family)